MEIKQPSQKAMDQMRSQGNLKSLKRKKKMKKKSHIKLWGYTNAMLKEKFLAANIELRSERWGTRRVNDSQKKHKKGS